MQPLKADEGMWLPALISQRIEDMQAKGFKLSAEDIYSVNQASLKDAVVLFGSGCTGELVSDQGLLFTNHHCGYSYIQKHSSVEHDYLKDGFWALNRGEELPNPGLTVRFLERMEDVTAQVLKGYKPGKMDEQDRAKIVRKNSEKLKEQAVKDGKGLEKQRKAQGTGRKGRKGAQGQRGGALLWQPVFPLRVPRVYGCAAGRRSALFHWQVRRGDGQLDVAPSHR